MEVPFEIEEGVLTDTVFGTDVTTLTIPNSVTKINGGALQYHRVVTLTLPDSVTSVNEYAFWGLTRLRTLIVPYHFRDISSLRILREGSEGRLTSLVFRPRLKPAFIA